MTLQQSVTTGPTIVVSTQSREENGVIGAFFQASLESDPNIVAIHEHERDLAVEALLKVLERCGHPGQAMLYNFVYL